MVATRVFRRATGWGERVRNDAGKKKLVGIVLIACCVVAVLAISCLGVFANDDFELLEGDGATKLAIGANQDADQGNLPDNVALNGDASNDGGASSNLSALNGVGSPNSESAPNGSAQGGDGSLTGANQELDPKVALVYVHVAGAVARPGLYQVPEDARVLHAIEVAGGFSPGAASDAINLAQSVADGERIYVPTVEEVAEGGYVASDSPSDSSSGKVNINTANESDLQSLPGVGPVLAQKIISYRKEYGPFKKPEDLMNVSGIGEKTFAQMASYVVL